MRITVVRAPVSLLLEPDLTAAANVLWLAIRVQSEPATPTRLAASAGLTLATIRKHLAQLEAVGWYSPSTGVIERSLTAGKVSIPASLLPECRVRPQAKLLHGILQTVPIGRIWTSRRCGKK